MKKLVLSLWVGLVLISGCSFQSKNEPPNTIHTYTIAKIKGMDPIHAEDLYSGRETGKVYEGLYQYHYLKRPYTLIPALAEEMPKYSKDGKTLVIKLKKGVVFQDDASFKVTNGKGREMTADDVIYSYKRLADPKNASPGWWLFEEKIVGLNEWRDQASKAGQANYDAPVEGLKALDPYSVQIQLTKPSYQFIYALAMPFTGIVPREAVEMYGKEFINHAVGTGPYRLEAFNGASKVVYTKNPTFRKEFYPTEGDPGDKEKGLLQDAGKQLPFADKVVVQVIIEDQPRWLNFLAGKVDASEIPKDSFEQAIKNGELSADLKSKNITLHRYPMLDLTHESFNMTDPVVGKNKLLRQALSLSHDTKPLIELFYNGRAIPAQGPIPPGLAGYDPAYKNPYRQANLEKAKELLAKARYPGGKDKEGKQLEIEYMIYEGSTSRQFAEYLQKEFAQVGVKLNVMNYSWPEFLAKKNQKKGQMFGMAWGADYPDAENFLQLFYCKSLSPGPNDANYCNPEYDRLFEKALTLKDSPERTDLYKKMAKVLEEDVPRIMGVHRLNFALTQPWLKNYKWHDMDHNRVKYWRIDPTLKK